MSDRTRWIEEIKKVRGIYGYNIFETERFVLEIPEWRRWVERQINSDDQCRRIVLSHIKSHGPNALIEKDSDRLKVR